MGLVRYVTEVISLDELFPWQYTFYTKPWRGSAVQKLTLMFADGQSRELCHDGTGGVFDGDFPVGVADDPDNIASGGGGELYSWGAFTVESATPCRGQCDACPAG